MANIVDGLKRGTPYLDSEYGLLHIAEQYIAIAAGDETRVPHAMCQLLSAIVRLTNKMQSIDDYAHGIRIDF